MDHLSSAYVHGNVIDIVAAGIEQQISRLCAADRYLASLCRLIPGTAPRCHAEVGINALCKSGAVRTVCQAGSAIYIRISQELFGISHYG